MSATETRTHVIMPTDLLKKIDERVGPRRRSKFIVDLAQREIARLELLEAAKAAAGSLRDADVPKGWETSDSAARWVHALRQEDLARQERLERLRETSVEEP